MTTGLRVEVAFNAGFRTWYADRVWTDITEYVEAQSRMQVTYGRNDELTKADANKLTGLVLDNRDGRFTLGNAASPYYPNVLVSRMIRVLMDGFHPNPDFESGISGWSATNATLSQSSTQAHGGTWSLRASSSTAAPISVQTATGTSGMRVVPAEQIVVGAWLRPAGATSRTCSLNVTWYDAAGASISTVGVDSDTSVAGSWIRLRGDVVAPSTAAFASMQVAISTAASSEIYYIDDVEFARPRFTGYVDQWPLEFPGGSDSYATATISASSRLSRLGLSAPRQQPVDAQILENSLLARAEYYWPLTDSKESTIAVEASSRGEGFAIEANPDPAYGAIVLGAGGKPEDADDLGDGRTACRMSTSTLPGLQGRIRATLPTALSVAGDITIGVAVKVMNPIPSAGTYYSFLKAGGIGNLELIDLPLSSTTYADRPAESGDTQVLFYYFHRSSPTQFTYEIRRGNFGTVLASGTVTPSTFADVTQITIAPPTTAALGANDVVVGRVAAWSRALSVNEQNAIASAVTDQFYGETTSDRFERYAKWAGIYGAEYEVLGAPSLVTMSGSPKAGGKIVDLLRQVETTENGALHDNRAGHLILRGRGGRYGLSPALTIDATQQLLGRDYQPKADRQGLANVGVGKNALGTANYTYVNEDSRTDYGDTVYDVETHAIDPEEALQLAALRVNANAAPRPRAASASLRYQDFSGADLVALATLDVDSKVQITNRPSATGSATADYFVEGYTETLDPFDARISLNLSPASPVGDSLLLDSATYGVLDQNHLAL